MDDELEQWINEENWEQCYNYSKQKLMKAGLMPTQRSFFQTIKAYSLLRLRRQEECKEILDEIKPFKQTDAQTVLYLNEIFVLQGENENATRLLEGVKTLHGNTLDIGKNLFFAYVRENKIQQQQIQSLNLYKTHNITHFAEWSVESMYLVSKNLKVETKILDIAYLVILKIMKDDKFSPDPKFINLFVKVLQNQWKYKDAIDLLNKMSIHFEDRFSFLCKQAELEYMNGKYINAINIYFGLIRASSVKEWNPKIFQQIQTCIRIIINDLADSPSSDFEFKKEYLDGMTNTDSSYNFEKIDETDSYLQMIKVTYLSIKGMRNVKVDSSQKRRYLEVIDQIKKTSYLAEIELLYNYAFHCPRLPTTDLSTYMQLIKEYIDKFYDKSDVATDLKPYMQILKLDDCVSLKKHLEGRVTKIIDDEKYQQAAMEKAVLDQQKLKASKGSKEGRAARLAEVEKNKAKAPISIKVLRMEFVLHKISRGLGLYSNDYITDQKQKMEIVNGCFKLFLQVTEYMQKPEDVNGSQTFKESGEGSPIKRSPTKKEGGFAGLNLDQKPKITELDENNSEDLLIIAVETLYELKQFEFSLLNPINMQMIVMCEWGLPHFPESVRIYSWLLKLYGKLGLVKSIQELGQKFPTVPSAIKNSIGMGLVTSKSQMTVNSQNSSNVQLNSSQQMNTGLQSSVRTGSMPAVNEKDVDQDVQALGAYLISIYTDFGFENQNFLQLSEALAVKHIDDIQEIKNQICRKFLERDFEPIEALIKQNERVNNAPLQKVLQVGQTMVNIANNVDNVQEIHAIFNNKFDCIDQACTYEFEDGVIEPRSNQEEREQIAAKKNFLTDKKVDPLQSYGKSRDKIRVEEFLQSTYVQTEANKKKVQASIKERQSQKGLVRLFGQKNIKNMKFYGWLLQCLRHSYESKSENLNLDMNYYAQLKGELSIEFLRNPVNVFQTIKVLMRIFAGEDKFRLVQEANETKILERHLRDIQTVPENQEKEKKRNDQMSARSVMKEARDPDEKQIFKPAPDVRMTSTQKQSFEKLIEKLLEWNERVNVGKEISVIDYFAKINILSPFMANYDTQRHLRKVFFEEFKIHSYNYLSLLFESVNRLLLTNCKADKSSGKDENKQTVNTRKVISPVQSQTNHQTKHEIEQQYYYTKNYNKCRDQAAKKPDKFNTSIIGWTHTQRIIEVIESSFKELIQKIVSTSEKKKQLTTTSGKVLNERSKYCLREEKKYILQGKSAKLDYQFHVDVKQEEGGEEVEDPEEKLQQENELKRQQNVFVLNLIDFNIFKLRSVVFFLQFPVAYTLLIINVWFKILPKQPTTLQGFTKDEIQSINDVKVAIKQLTRNISQQLIQLREFLNAVKKQKLMTENFIQISQHSLFSQFRGVFTNSPGVNVNQEWLDEMITSTFECMNDSFENTLDNTLILIHKRQQSIESYNTGPNYD